MAEDQFDDFLRLAQAVGYTTLMWAQIERQLDNWVMVSFKRCGGNSLLSEIPRSFSKKYGYLKKSFKGLAPLEPFRDHSLDLLERTNDLSETRHALTHGTLESMIPENGVFTFRHLIYGQHVHRVEMKTFDLNDWPPIETELGCLRHETTVVATRLLETFPAPRQ